VSNKNHNWARIPSLLSASLKVTSLCSITQVSKNFLGSTPIHKRHITCRALSFGICLMTHYGPPPRICLDIGWLCATHPESSTFQSENNAKTLNQFTFVLDLIATRDCPSLECIETLPLAPKPPTPLPVSSAILPLLLSGESYQMYCVRSIKLNLSSR
jgi:hypothetical protein